MMVSSYENDSIRHIVIPIIDAPMATVMLCLSLKNGEPCTTPLDGLRTTCRAKRCISLKTCKATYTVHHEIYRDLIMQKFYIEANAHRNHCLAIYSSDVRIAYLERTTANMRGIYLEHRVQQERERKAEEDLEQTRLLLVTLDATSEDYDLTLVPLRASVADIVQQFNSHSLE
jgi:hypothetical protein